jgi:hypothetical protein
VRAWLIASLAPLGVALLALIKEDLKDAAVCRWLARQMIFRAAERLPRGERARWREEAMSHAIDLPGRLPPLLWALDTYIQAGRWGRTRGAPTRWQALVTRLRATWQRLRSLPQTRARALSKQRHSAYSRATAQPLHVVAGARLDAAVAIPNAIVMSRADHDLLTDAWEMWVHQQNRAGQPHLSDQEFLAWLTQQRRDFEDDLDRRGQAWRQARAWRKAES